MTPDQCRAARALLGLSRPELGHVAHVSKNTIQSFESGFTQPSSTTIAKLRGALTSLSIRFLDDDHGVGVQRGPTIDEVIRHEEQAVRPHETTEAAARAPSTGAFGPAQSRAARAFLGLSQSEAAERAGLGLSLLVAFETGLREPRRTNSLKIRHLYESMGIVFTEIDGIPAIQAPAAPSTAREEAA